MIQPETQSVRLPTPGRKRVVLCVDDDFAVLSSLRRLLRSEPYEVLTASSAAQALGSLRLHPVDVVVSDERMPHTTGSEFLEEVRQRWPWVGRIILTGYPGEPGQIQSLKARVDLLLHKPWDDTELKEAVRRLLEEVERNAADLPKIDLGGEGG